MVFSWPVFAQKGKPFGLPCVIYPPMSIKVHSCAVVSDRTFISGLNTVGGGGMLAVAQRAGRAITSGYRP